MTFTVLAAGALSALAAVAAQSDRQFANGDQPAVVRLRLETDRTETTASAVLVHREDGPQQAVLYFLTSDSLLRDPSVPPPLLVPETEGESWGETPGPDIAVLRILTASSSLVPARVTLDPPRLGELFVIVSHDAAGARVVVHQRIGMVSERVAAGDTELQTATCVGAPAFSEKGVFGIVTQCEPNRPPIVTLLSAATDLLRRLIPALKLS